MLPPLEETTINELSRFNVLISQNGANDIFHNLLGPQEECLAFLTDLSQAFEEAQYFGTEDVTEFHAWAKASNGRLRRAYAFSGEQGAVLWDRGQVTEEEKQLGLLFPEATILSNSPDSASVFQIAGRWSLDPTRLDEVDCNPSTGLLGER